MLDLARGILGGQRAALQEPGAERGGLAVGCGRRGNGRRGGRAGPGQLDDAGLALAQVLGGALERLLRPGVGRTLVVHIAALDGEQGTAAQGAQALVELAGRPAEVLVAGVPEPEHGVAQPVQARGALAVQEGVQLARALRRFALALGADDDQQQPLAGQVARAVIGHGQEPRFGPAGAREPGQPLRQTARVAGLRAVEDGQDRRGLRLGGRGGLGHRRRLGRSLGRRRDTRQTGQVTADPGQLERREPGDGRRQLRRPRRVERAEQGVDGSLVQGICRLHGSSGGLGRDRVGVAGRPANAVGRRLEDGVCGLSND